MRLVQVAQRVQDLDRATAFYRRLLGTEPTARFDPPGLVFFDLDGTRLLLEVGATPATLYLGVPDVRATVAQLQTDGVEVSEAPHVIFRHDDATLGPAGTQEWMAFVTDSEGNAVGLVSHEPVPADAG